MHNLPPADAIYIPPPQPHTPLGGRSEVEPDFDVDFLSSWAASGDADAGAGSASSGSAAGSWGQGEPGAGAGGVVDGGFEDLLAGLERGEGLDAAAASASASAPASAAASSASLAESVPGVSVHSRFFWPCEGFFPHYLKTAIVT